jgi:hypothetical protein
MHLKFERKTIPSFLIPHFLNCGHQNAQAI